MTESLGGLTLSQLQAMEGHIPTLTNFLSRLLADTYEKFIDVFYKDLDKIISDLQENPELVQEDSEDRLTIEIKRALNHIGYSATHDAKHGGHTDLLVRLRQYSWIGEAKIHSNYDYLWQGFQQLNTRYSTGDTNQDCGGIVIYIFNKDAKGVMTTWQATLVEKNLPNFSTTPCPSRPLAFISTHTHAKSGLLYKVRHMPVMLYFKPEDKSGLTRKTSATRVVKS